MNRLLTWWQGLFRPAAIPDRLAPLVSEDGTVNSRICGLRDAVRSGWFNQASGELVSGFAITAADVVLDVGCGAGAATLFAARCGAEVIFSDMDADKINQLHQRIRAETRVKATPLVGDTNPLPLPDGHASRVIAMEMLEHVDDPAQVLAELVRVAKPGALLLLTVPDATGEYIQQQLAPASHFQKPNHIHIFTREQFASLVIDAGLVIENRQYYSFYWAMWMCLYWASSPAGEGATLDQIREPYPPLLNEWANTWHQLMQIPEGDKVIEKLNDLMPKSQIIIARKPCLTDYS